MRLAKQKPLFEKRTGAWVDNCRHIGGRSIPVAFSDNEKNTLAKHLASVEISELENACGTWAHFYELREADPTFGQVRASLENIAHLATQLAFAIEYADPHTKGLLKAIGQVDFGDYQITAKLQIQLETLAKAAAEEREDLPSQSRKSSPIFIVKLILDFLHERQRQIKPSKSVGSPFHTIVEACFSAMKIPENAESSIKAFNRVMKDDR